MLWVKSSADINEHISTAVNGCMPVYTSWESIPLILSWGGAGGGRGSGAHACMCVCMYFLRLPQQ